MNDNLNLYDIGPWGKSEYDFFKLQGFYTGTTVEYDGLGVVY